MWPFQTSRAKASDPSSEGLHCSFCGKHEGEVRKLIAGPTVYICDECIALCNDIIAEECDREETVASRPSWLGTTLACPLCRLEKPREDFVFVTSHRFLCRACATDVRTAHEHTPPG